jgi:hypothetical protein
MRTNESKGMGVPLAEECRAQFQYRNEISKWQNTNTKTFLQRKSAKPKRWVLCSLNSPLEWKQENFVL